MPYINRKICIAPMVGYTHTFHRNFLRFVSTDALLFTERVIALELPKKKLPQELSFHNSQFPLVAQIGGNESAILLEWAIRIEEMGFNEVNLNLGCPGITTTQLGYGAVLMLNPSKVANIIEKIVLKINIPFSVKIRIGINNHDSYDFLYNFVNSLYNAGCNTFYIHARKAILDGITTHLENRTIPQLNYEYARQIKKDFPLCNIILNGGIKTIENIKEYSSVFDGLMIGREIYSNLNILNLKFDLSARNLTQVEIKDRINHFINSYKSYLLSNSIEGIYGKQCIIYARRYLKRIFLYKDKLL